MIQTLIAFVLLVNRTVVTIQSLVTRIINLENNSTTFDATEVEDLKTKVAELEVAVANLESSIN